VAAEAIKKNDLSHLPEYEKRWPKATGLAGMKYLTILKRQISNFSDETLNNIAESALKNSSREETIGSIFRNSFMEPAITC